MKSEREIREMIETNMAAIESYLDEVGAARDMLRKNPGDLRFVEHIINQVVSATLDVGAIGALHWVLEEENSE